MCVVTVAALSVFFGQGALAQKQNTPSGTPVMWVDRGPIDQLDLFWGGSTPERAPPEVLAFSKNKLKGTSPGLKMIDAQGNKWGGKFNGSKGKEVHAEIAASRLAWAMGFNVEEAYFRNQGRVTFETAAPKNGAPDLRYTALLPAAQEFIDKNGRYDGHPMRLEREEPEDIEYEQTWFYNSNPIKNNPATAKHFSAQVIFNTLIGNWDLGKSVEKTNNKILGRKNANGEIEDLYIVSDYGASFGQIGKRSLLSRNHTKYVLTDYDLKSNGGKNDPPVNFVKDSVVHLNMEGEIINEHAQSVQMVPLDHAQWFAKVIEPLKIEQIRRSFEAAGATDAEIEGFSRVFKARVDQFVACVTQPEGCRTPTRKK